MFCVYCGTQIPDDAVFCSKCGKPQKDHQQAKPTQSASIPEWEYWTWDANPPTGISLSVRKFEDRDGSRDGMTEGQARLHFWQEIQSKILPVIHHLQDDGWEPISEVGASAIKLQGAKVQKGDFAGLMKAMFGNLSEFGWTCHGITIRFRRQKGSGKYSVNDLPNLIKRAGY
jgi:hypothetical protein